MFIKVLHTPANVPYVTDPTTNRSCFKDVSIPCRCDVDMKEKD